jgi:two-component system CheB/CheR fusion protein
LRKTLRPIVRAALQTVLATNESAVRDGITIKIDDRFHNVAVIVEPISDGAADARLFVVAFRDGGPKTGGTSETNPSETDASSIRVAEHELRTVRTQLQSTIDELETANEEMKSATEEYQSVNEELQSTNEELETSKEEMQSINEELQTVNAEMASKNDTLTRLNSDLKNLLDSTQIATIFLDNALRIKNYTPGITEIFPLREGDRGRPITDIVSLLVYDDLKRDITVVLRDLATIEREVALKGAGTTFILRVRPYRTVDNVIDGVVMTFVDITQRKASEEQTALLLAELDHRVRNILAIVSSVIAQTLQNSPTPAAFARAMEGRISAIARAHSVLTQMGQGDGASLRDLLATELAPYDGGPQSISITGIDITLTPRAGLSLALAFHELASNAAKYGALSSNSGSLAVSWTVDRTSGTMLNFIWAETGGPPIAGPPSQRGFGSTLIERTLSHEMDAVVRQEFRPSGLYCTIDIPLMDDIGQVRGLRR